MDGSEEVKERECLEKREESAANSSFRTSLDALDECSCCSFFHAEYSVMRSTRSSGGYQRPG